jgi:hypothetical protein
MDANPPTRVVALLNVTAGGIEGHKGEDISEVVRSAFAARGIICEVQALSGGKLADAATLASTTSLAAEGRIHAHAAPERAR